MGTGLCLAWPGCGANEPPAASESDCQAAEARIRACVGEDVAGFATACRETYTPTEAANVSASHCEAVVAALATMSDDQRADNGACESQRYFGGTRRYAAVCPGNSRSTPEDDQSSEPNAPTVGFASQVRFGYSPPWSWQCGVLGRCDQSTATPGKRPADACSASAPCNSP